jgi:hypothetical protein
MSRFVAATPTTQAKVAWTRWRLLFLNGRAHVLPPVKRAQRGLICLIGDPDSKSKAREATGCDENALPAGTADRWVQRCKGWLKVRRWAIAKQRVLTTSRNSWIGFQNPDIRWLHYAPGMQPCAHACSDDMPCVN